MNLITRAFHAQWRALRLVFGAIIIATLLPSLPTSAVIEQYSFENAQQEQLYQSMIKELRCLVCQNQNLADSNADLAKDLRNKTYEMVTTGNSRKEIADFMVARYGDFVLYRPPVNSSTALLWFGPFVFLALALLIAWRIIRRRRQGTALQDIQDIKLDAQHAARAALQGESPAENHQNPSNKD